MLAKKVTRKDLALYARWVLTNTLSWMIGLIGIFAVITFLLAPLNPPWTYDHYGRYRWSLEASIEMVGLLHVIIGAIAGGVGGYLYGVSQHSFLKYHFREIPGWKKTSILNWSLGCAIAAAISWLFASLSPRSDGYGQLYPPDPIGDFTLVGLLSSMTAGAAIGTTLACFTQGSLLRKTILLLEGKPRFIRSGWRATSIFGGILGLFLECRFNCCSWPTFPIELLRSIPRLYLLSSILIPGAVLGITSGLVLVRAFKEVRSTDTPSRPRYLSRLVGLSALAIAGIAILESIHLGLQTCGWLDRLLSKTGCHHILKGEALSREISFSLEGSMMTALPIRGKLKLWEVSTGQLIHQYEISDVETVILSNDGELLAIGGFNSPIRLWQLPAGDLLHTFNDPHLDPFGLVNHLAFSQDDQLLASVRSGKEGDSVQMWRSSDGALLGEFEAVMPNSLLFLPDAQSLLVGTGAGTVWLWEPPYDQPQILLEGLGRVRAMDFTPDGAFVAIISIYDGIQVWRIVDSIMLWSMDVGYQRCLDISPDGSLMATTSHNSVSRYQDPIYIFRIEDGTIEYEVQGQCDVAFTPDGRYLASYGDDSDQVRLWSVEDVQETQD
jgi:hypothetical protein